MTIQFYTYNGPDNTINKTAYIRSGITLTSDKLSGDQNTLQVNVVITSATCPTWNYARINEFNRYYFVGAPTWLADGLYQLTLTVDPLYTYRTQIMALSGVCQYSGSGSPLLYDPRIVYNTPPSVSRLDPVTLSGFPPTGGDWMILMVCDYYDNRNSSNLTARNNRRYALMTQIGYSRFMTQYIQGLSMTEEKRVMIGHAIKSVSLVKWVNTGGLTPSADGILNFYTAEIQEAGPSGGGGPAGIDINVGVGNLYIMDNDTYIPPYYLAFFIQPTRYCDRKAKRAVWIPFIGTVSIDPDILGVGYSTASYIGFEIKYDPSSNLYVVTPGTAPLGRDIATDGFARTFPASATKISNLGTVGWASDTSNQYVEQSTNQQLAALSAQGVTGIIAALATGGASIPASIAGLSVGINNFNLSQERLQYQQAGSFVSQGTANGGIPDRVYCYWTGELPPALKDPAAYMEILTNEPAPGSYAFQQRFGYPDGAYRSISGLRGYFVMAEPVLTGFGGVSEVEKDRIRAALAGGVFVD